MELNFFESDAVPQPRDKVKITQLSAQPYPDGWRVRIMLSVTPFQERPNLEVEVVTADNKPIAEMSIIETMHHVMEFTVHIRGTQNPAGDYLLRAELYYDDHANVQHRLEVPFTVAARA